MPEKQEKKMSHLPGQDRHDSSDSGKRVSEKVVQAFLFRHAQTPHFTPSFL